jgi:biotin transporter BioY
MSKQPTTTGSGQELPHPHPEAATTDRSTTEQMAEALTAPLAVAQRVLPDNPVPVVLGAGALALAGLIEWPVAAAIGLGYVALRRWHPQP